jgi:hypothetical protein
MSCQPSCFGRTSHGASLHPGSGTYDERRARPLADTLSTAINFIRQFSMVTVNKTTIDYAEKHYNNLKPLGIIEIIFLTFNAMGLLERE